MKTIFLSLICLFYFLGYSQQEYFVAVNGDNSNNGTINSPFETIFKASQVAQPGDIIQVRGGLYRNSDFNDGDIWNGTVAGKITCNGTATQYITFQPYQNEEVIFEFDANYGVKISNSSYIIFQGFKIKGIGEQITYGEALSNWGLYMLADGSIHDITGNESLMPLPAGTSKPSYYNGRGLVANNCHHIKLKNNIVYNCPSSGIRAEQSDYVDIIGNTVYHNTYWTTQGVGAITIAEASDLDSSSDYKFNIEQNLVYENENKMISWNPTKSFITYVIDEGSGIFLTRNQNTYLHGKININNNIVYKSGASGIMCHYTDRTLIAFNSLYYNGANNDGFPGGIGINNTNHVIIANNLIHARPTKWAIGTTAQPNTNYTIENNIVYNENSSQSIYNNLSTGWSNSNPLFVDPTLNNFNIQSTSPAINAASTNYIIAKDFNNNIRADDMNDVGAIEYNATLSLPVTNSNSFLLYPNPVIDHLWISSNQTIKNIYIFNILGQKIVSINETNENVKDYTIDLNFLEKGMYIIKCNSESNIFLKQ